MTWEKIQWSKSTEDWGGGGCTKISAHVVKLIPIELLKIEDVKGRVYFFDVKEDTLWRGKRLKGRK